MPKKVKIPEEAMKYFRMTGARGGKARAERHTEEELRKWGKMGGRPRASGRKTIPGTKGTTEAKKGGK